MTALVWDKTGERLYEVGVDHGVLYPMKSDGTGYDTGVAWNGLTNVSESPEGAEANPQYADNIKYINLMSAEEFKATIEAFTYPDEFAACDGSIEVADGVYAGQQTRRAFGFAYRTKLGNDTIGEDYGYKLHLVYGCTAAPSEKAYETINDSPEAITFSWEIDSTPAEMPAGFKPTSVLTIDSTKTPADRMAKLEAELYGTTEKEPRLPMPAEVIKIVGKAEEYNKPDVADAQPILGTEQRLGKTISDLQDSVVIDNEKHTIAGTLKKIDTPWTEFDSKGPNTGHFLAINLERQPADATMSVELTEATNKGYKQFDPGDNELIALITKNTQKINVKIEKEGREPSEKIVTYTLDGLTLQDS